MKDKNDTVVNPIYEWNDSDVWEFLRGGRYPYNPMYDMGYHRVGCIGCPLATWKQKKKEFADFPYFKDMYIKAFDELAKVRKAEGKTDVEKYGNKWATGKDIFDWWTEEYKHVTKGQMNITDYEKDGFIFRERET